MKDLWRWQQWQGLPYLTCQLLASWQHGFFTKQFSPRPPAALTEILQPQAKAYRVRQVHGDVVLTPQEIGKESSTEKDSLPAADGLISHGLHQCLWVASADCTPALLGDVATGRVAAVHAGWRGTAKRILPNTIARFLAMGSELDNLRIALGPGIAGKVYQVTEAVAAEVGASLKLEASEPESILKILKSFPDSPLIADPKPGHIRLDVRRVNSLQLQALGIEAEQIAIAPHCTYQEPESFFSYRRTHEKQVQWSGIVSGC